MPIKKRDQLSPGTEKSEKIFAKKFNSLQEAFPTIQKLSFKVTEKDMGNPNPIRRWNFDESNFQPVVNCSNPLCYKGGLRLDTVLDEMIRKNKTEMEETKSCQGYEGSPKGKKRSGTCYHSFQLKVNIEYK